LVGLVFGGLFGCVFSGGFFFGAFCSCVVVGVFFFFGVFCFVFCLGLLVVFFFFCWLGWVWFFSVLPLSARSALPLCLTLVRLAVRAEPRLDPFPLLSFSPSVTLG